MLLIKILVRLFVLEHLFAGSAYKSNQSITELILSTMDTLCPYSRICERFDEGLKPPSKKKWTNEYVPCCGACSCGVDCGKIGKCCFSGDDYVSARHSENYTVQTDREPESNDFNSSCLFPGTKRRTIRYLYRYYEMIDTCPFKKSTKEHNSTQNQFSERCGDETVVWDSVFPVYSPSTKRLYKNRICSGCHDVTDGVVWDMSMTCFFESRSEQLKLDISEVLYLDPEKTPDIYVDPEKKPESLECFITYSFPGNWSDIEHARCTKEPLMNNCSGDSFEVPANINMTPAEVVEACESGFYSPVTPSSTNQYIYANVFCSICNLDYNKALTMCVNPNAISRDSGQLSFLLRGTEFQDKYVDKQKAEKRVGKACLDIPHSNPVFNKKEFIVMAMSSGLGCQLLFPTNNLSLFWPIDTKLGVCVAYTQRQLDIATQVSVIKVKKRPECRRVYCRTGQIQDSAGECKYVNITMFTTYEMTIDLLPNENIPAEFVESDFSSLINGWLKGPFSTTWKLVMLFFEPYTVQGKYIIRKFIICLRIKTSISFEGLLTNVNRLLKKHWYANLNGTTFELRQELSRIYDFTNLGNKRYCTTSSISKDYEPICALTQLYMPLDVLQLQSLIITKMVFCEQVELQDSEYDVIVTKKVIYYKLKNLTLFEGEFVSVYRQLTGNYTVRLCLADAGFKIVYDYSSGSFPIRKVHISFLTLFLMFSFVF